MENEYELTLIFSPNTEAKAIESLVAKVEKIIKGAKGKITKKDKPETKDLAYEIKKFQKGIYMYMTFTSDNTSGLQLEKIFKIEENLIRFLLIKNFVNKKRVRGQNCSPPLKDGLIIKT